MGPDVRHYSVPDVAGVRRGAPAHKRAGRSYGTGYTEASARQAAQVRLNHGRDGGRYVKKSHSANGGQGSKDCSASSKQTTIYSSARPTANAKSSRRTTKRGRASAKTCRREVAIYDGQNLVGTVKIADIGKATAYDANGKRLGVFATLEAASAALDTGATS
jgi:hypothetical protein